MRLLLDGDLGDVHPLVARAAFGLKVHLSMTRVPALLTGEEGGEDGKGREDRRVLELSLEVKVDDLLPDR